MSLITKQDLALAAGLNKWGVLKNPMASMIMKFAKINKINI